MDLGCASGSEGGLMQAASQEGPAPACRQKASLLAGRAVVSCTRTRHWYLLPAAVRCDMVLHRVLVARDIRTYNIGGEVRHGVTSGVSRETSLNKHVTPHLHREYQRNLQCQRALLKLEPRCPRAVGRREGWGRARGRGRQHIF